MGRARCAHDAFNSSFAGGNDLSRRRSLPNEKLSQTVYPRFLPKLVGEINNDAVFGRSVRREVLSYAL